MISKISKFQKLYDICFLRLNHIIEVEIKKKGSEAKTFLPNQFKDKLKKK